MFQKQNEEVDFKSLSDDELWNYIRGQFFGLGDLSKIWGFGVTQVDTY